MNRAQRPVRSLRRRLRYMLSLLIAAAFIWLLPAAIGKTGSFQIAAAASDPVIAAAGDIACDPANSLFNGGLGSSSNCRQKYTSDLLVNASLAAVLDLGDNQYYCGGYQAYLQSYDLSWGRIKAITHPSVGNHEYLTSGGTGCDINNTGASGYFNYFGSAAGTPGKGYYSFDVGTWHIIALNSNCSDAGGCGSGSPQYTWLQADLAAHTNFCTLAYWHIPLYSSGGRAANNSRSFWQLLYNNNADLILNGHDHIYERFAPQDASATLDTARGMREFIVGTGGSDHTSVTTSAANSELRNTNTFGVMKLTLHPTGYDWQFVPEAGKTFTDSGSTSCHGSSPAPTATPTRTATATATATATLVPPTNTPTPIATATRTATATATATLPLATNTPTASATPTALPTSIITGSYTFLPQADAYVNSGSPTTNYGSGLTLRVDGSPEVHSYLRFTVQGLGGKSITRARLLMFANSGSTSGINAMAVSDNTWLENTITYNNAPALGRVLASSSAVVLGTWVTMDVTSYVTAEGTYNFGANTLGATAISLASRESGGNAPELIIDVTGSPTATATAAPLPTSTNTPTATANNTNTPTATATPTNTNTPTATATATLPLPTSTNTPTATATAINTNTPTATATTTLPAPTSTNTPTATATATAVLPSPTYTPTPTATSTNTDTPTATATSTATATQAILPTDTPTDVPTVTPTDTPALEATATPTATFTGTASDTPTPTDTGTSTPTATQVVSPTDTNTPTATATSAAISTPTDTPTASATPSPVPTDTSTPTPTATRVVSPTNTSTPTTTPTQASTSTPTPGPTATPTSSAGQSVTFVPDADSYVNSGSPGTNYGAGLTLRVDGSPDVHSYLRFTVQGLGGKPITRARLLVFANSGSASGINALAVSENTWGEKTITYNNAPALGQVLASSKAVTTGTWITLDVTSYLFAEGTYNFGLNTAGATAISFGSRESGANAPQLIIDTGP